MKQRILLALVLGVGLALALPVLLDVLPPADVRAAPAATIRYVLDDGGTDTGDCTGDQNPCKTVQYALAQAGDGDTIRVGDGVYSGIVVITRSVTLEGGWSVWSFMGWLLWNRPSPCEPDLVTLDRLGCGRVISITGDITPVIDCFTITGGDANGLGGDPPGNNAGGGIYSKDAAPIITNNVITGNYGCQTCSGGYGRGGGIYLLNAPATAVISGNLIANNVADESTWGQGGGVMLRDSDVQVLNNTIEYNRAGHVPGDGGGIAVRGGSPTIADNDILDNVAGLAVYCHGGGVYVRSSTTVTIERNLIEGNIALNSAGDTGRGGGIYYTGNPTVSAVIRDNTIRDNTAAPYGPYGEGGGIYLGGLTPSSQVSGNTLEGNVAGYNDNGNGGGLYVDESEVTIAHNHISGNSATWAGDLGEGGGLFANGGVVLIQSNVITGNFGAGFPGPPSTADGYGGGVAISGSLSIVQDNWIVGNGGTNGTGGAGGAGGGVYGYLGSVQIAGNTIADNYATQGNTGFGGGLYLEQITPWLDGNTILDNEAVAGLYGRGGGVRINNCPVFTLTNNIIAHNEASERGSGVAIYSSGGLLAHNTIAENQPGDGLGVYVGTGSGAAMINNIIVNHWQGIANGDPGGSVVTATHTLFEGNGADYGPGITSAHEISGPAMLLPNYHLSGGSGAINTAAALSWVTNDIDGESRPFGAAPDVGADEATCLARVGGVDYTVIQDAIDAATSDQTVMVVKGVCYENLSITKTVTLEGGWTPTFSVRNPDPASVSTIDGMGAGRVISITEVSGSIAPRIDGFTIAHGDATGLGNDGAPAYDTGGGIYSYYANTTVENCIVKDNVASTTGIGWGGGLGFVGGNVTLSNTQVLSNTASTISSGYGGGAYFRSCNATVGGNTMQNNVASSAGYGFGGGLAFHFVNDAALQDNVVQGNRAAAAFGAQGGGLYVYYTSMRMNGDHLEGNLASTASNVDYGGGLYAREHSDLSLENVTVAGNTADNGGGLYVLTSTATISGCRVYGNAADTGGGILLDESNGTTLAGNNVYSNTAIYNGGGVYLWYSDGGTLAGNHVHSNTSGQMGGGVAIGYSPGAMLEENDVFSNEADTGGGVNVFYSDNTTLTGNSLYDNEAGEDGGGVYFLSSANATLADSDIYNNRATSGAGASLAGSDGAVLTGNRVHDNLGGEGSSGIALYSCADATLSGNEIYLNWHGERGGVWIQQSTNVTLTRNAIYSNTSYDDGGGLYLEDSGNVLLSANTFHHNAAHYGGGMYLRDNPNPLVLVNNIVADNQAPSGSGIYVKGCAPDLLHTTLARNIGGDGIGVYVTSGGVAMTNTILVSHTTGVYVSSDSTATLEATLWGSGPWANITDWEGDGTILTGTVNLWGDPAFVDPDNGDYHIGSGSAAIDAGVDAGVTTDIDHDPRPIGSVPDIGADEYARHVYLPLVLR